MILSKAADLGSVYLHFLDKKNADAFVASAALGSPAQEDPGG